MSISARRAISADTAELLELINAHAEFERATAAITAETLATLLALPEPPSFVLVAEQDHSLLGYAAVTRDYALWSGAHFAHLDCLYVAEHVRGNGIGRALLHAASALARSWNCSRLEWQTPAWNSDAIGFYRRIGAKAANKARFSLPLG